MPCRSQHLQAILGKEEMLATIMATDAVREGYCKPTAQLHISEFGPTQSTSKTAPNLQQQPLCSAASTGIAMKKLIENHRAQIVCCNMLRHKTRIDVSGLQTLMLS